MTDHLETHPQQYARLGREAVEWRPVPGLDDRFEVSNNGVLRRRKHLRRRDRSAGSFVATAINSNGYVCATLTVHYTTYSVRLHALVAEAFHGPRPKGLDVAHLNGIRTDNRAENLTYVTRKENMSHTIAHGTRNYGERNSLSRLTAEQVMEIRATAGNTSSVAAKYGINPRHVWKLRKCLRWAHLPAVSLPGKEHQA